MNHAEIVDAACGERDRGRALRADLSVGLPIPETQENTYGGACEVNCLDHYRRLVELTEDWQEITIEWGDLAQVGWGTPADFTPERVQALMFAMSGATGGVDFDWWIDNVELVE